MAFLKEMVHSLKVLIGKVEISFPVEWGDVVFAGADVIANDAVDGFVDGGKFLGREGAGSEEFVNGGSMKGTEEFAFGVGPAVLFGTGDVDGAWGNEGSELVLVDGAGVFVVVVFTVFVDKPVGEGGVDAFDGLSELAAAQCGAMFGPLAAWYEPLNTTPLTPSPVTPLPTSPSFGFKRSPLQELPCR